MKSQKTEPGWNLCICVVLLLGHCVARAGTAEEAEPYARAQKWMDRGDFDQAIRALDEVIRQKPEWARAYTLRAACRMAKRRQYEKAIADLSEAIRLDPKYAEAYLLRGHCYSITGQRDKYGKDLLARHKLGSREPDLFEQRALPFRLHLQEDALSYPAVLREIKRSVCYSNNWTFVLEYVVRAVVEEQQVIAPEPEGAKDYCRRGRARVEKGNLDGVIMADFSEANRLDPKSPEAVYYRGLVYATKGELVKAITDLTEAIRRAPRFVDAYVYRGFAFANEKQLDNAIADLTKAIELDPRCGTAYGYRAQVYDEIGNRVLWQLDKAKAKSILQEEFEKIMRRGMTH